MEALCRLEKELGVALWCRRSRTRLAPHKLVANFNLEIWNDGFENFDEAVLVFDFEKDVILRLSLSRKNLEEDQIVANGRYTHAVNAILVAYNILQLQSLRLHDTHVCIAQDDKYMIRVNGLCLRVNFAKPHGFLAMTQLAASRAAFLLLLLLFSTRLAHR